MFSIAKICADVLESLSRRARKKKLRFSLEIDPSVPRFVKGNRARLENILHLLLSDIIEISSKKTLIFSVVTRRFTQSGLEILFSVEWLSRDFSQNSSGPAESSGQPGLGFSICSAVITSMGGFLSVKKENKKGIALSFFLPFTSVPSEEDIEEPAANIMLVEDNPMNRKIITACLEHGGYTVRTADSGKKALDMLFEKEWDLILMDIQMPDMDGIQTTAAIRAAESERGRRTPVVAITAHAREEDRESCLKAGMDGYLSKPVKLETLLATVAEKTGDIRTAHESGHKILDPRSSILSFTEGDEDLARKIVEEFLLLTPPLLDDVRKAFERNDRKTLYLLSHRVKCNLAYFGEGNAFFLAETLHNETDTLSGDELASLLLRLFSETEHLIEELADMWGIND